MKGFLGTDIDSKQASWQFRRMITFYFISNSKITCVKLCKSVWSYPSRPGLSAEFVLAVTCFFFNDGVLLRLIFTRKGFSLSHGSFKPHSGRWNTVFSRLSWINVIGVIWLNPILLLFYIVFVVKFVIHHIWGLLCNLFMQGHRDCNQAQTNWS